MTRTSATVQDIAKLSEKVAELAKGISDRIVLFETWLTNLPGRVPITVKDESLLLRLDREGKQWILYVTTPEKECENWPKLTDASLTLKKEAMKRFPRLLDELVQMKTNSVESLEKATAEFDEFVKTQCPELLKKGEW